MSSLLMFRALPYEAVVDTNANFIGETNLLTPDPKEVGVHPVGAGGVWLRFDLGSVQTFDTAFWGFHTYSAGSVADLRAGNINGAGNPVIVGTGAAALFAPSDRAVPRRQHGFARFALQTARYVETYLVRGNPAVDATLGIFAVGKALQPFYGREWGSGRTLRDMSDVTELRGGGFGIDRGARVPGFQFTVGDLSDPELVQVWDIAEEVGGSGPILVCEDPDVTDGLNERLHWGLFDRPEAYERDSPGRNRWSFRVKGWN